MCFLSLIISISKQIILFMFVNRQKLNSSIRWNEVKSITFPWCDCVIVLIDYERKLSIQWPTSIMFYFDCSYRSLWCSFDCQFSVFFTWNCFHFIHTQKKTEFLIYVKKKQQPILHVNFGSSHWPQLVQRRLHQLVIGGQHNWPVRL